MDLMKQIKFENVNWWNIQAFMFAYSMREKTHAYRNYVDNVPEDVK
jgi:tRNA A37 methylthiotransferase MiaB